MSNQPYQKSQPYYFISYCREEVTFVDSLFRELEKRGINNWVDIRDLVPGRSWQTQLDEGVKNAEAVLLVVSKESMKSGAVKDEWQKAQGWGKRIILLLFEPAKIPEALVSMKPEHVNFNRNFNKATTELVELLKHEKRSGDPIPKKGKRLPEAVGWLFIVNILLFFTAFIGQPASYDLASTSNVKQLEFDTMYATTAILFWLPAMWQIFILPWKLYRRTHAAIKYRNGLALFFLSNLVIVYGYFSGLVEVPRIHFTFLNLGLCLLLYYLLVSPSMYRWAGPSGVILRMSPPDLSGHTDNGTPKLVGIEYAPQDSPYADAIKSAIIAAGHKLTTDLPKADTILTLLSVYKTNSEFDPQQKEMYPILLQRCNVDKKFSELQRIDLRYGKVSINAIANLLDEPYELNRVLGVLPVRTNIMPAAIQWATTLLLIPLVEYLYNFLGEVAAKVFLGKLAPPVTAWDVWSNLLFAAGILLFQRFLTTRKIKYLPFLSFWWAVTFAALISIAAGVPQLNNFTGTVDIMTYVFLITSLFPILIVAVFWKELRLWLPAK
jgi:hypothetical protein